jgi:hypothetical protein
VVTLCTTRFATRSFDSLWISPTAEYSIIISYALSRGRSKTQCPSPPSVQTTLHFPACQFLAVPKPGACQTPTIAVVPVRFLAVPQGCTCPYAAALYSSSHATCRRVVLHLNTLSCACFRHTWMCTEGAKCVYGDL